MNTSCQKEPDPFNPDFNDSTGDIIDTLTGIGHEESGDYQWDQNSEKVITLSGNTINTNTQDVEVSGRFAIIKSAGNYSISGSLDNGAIVVDASDNDLIRLILNNVTIHNSDGPAILVEDARKALIYLPDNTSNTLSDGNAYANPEADPNATLFSKADLTIFGGGSLNVEANYNDAITGKDGLLIKEGNYNITALDDGIRGKNYLIIQSGNIMVESGGDSYKSDETDNPEPGNIIMYGGAVNAISGGDGLSAEGNVYISAGSINIVSGGGNEADTSSVSQKGIKAGSSVILQADSIRIDAVDHAIDSDGSIAINSGKYILLSARAGIHSNTHTRVTDGEIQIIRSMEGFESHEIFIEGGIIRVISIDDCLNATAGYDVDFDDQSLIEISNGYMMFDCINGDGIDSNGELTITGGTVIIHGPDSGPNVTMDSNGEFNINEGFVVGSGPYSELMEYPDSTSKQNSIVVIFASEIPAETVFNITNGNGENILTFTPSGPYQSMIFSSSQLISEENYSIYIEGDAEETNRDGLSQGDYSPGIWVADFEVEDVVTILPGLKNGTGH